MEFADLSCQVIGCAIEGHWISGLGLSESAQEQSIDHKPHLDVLEPLRNFNMTKLKDGIRRFVL